MTARRPPALLIFQCTACRSLVGAERAVLDVERERAGLVCDVCGAASWLPVGERGQADVVDVEPSPARGSVRALSSSPAIPVDGGAVSQEGGQPALSQTAEVPLPALAPPQPDSSGTSSVSGASTASPVDSSAPAPLASAPAPSSMSESVPVRATQGVPAGPRRERIVARLAAAAGASDAQRDLAQLFLRLLDSWESEAEHKQFLKKASTLNELAFAGGRYRIVLDELPGDLRAKTAQNDILSFAMSALTRERDLGRVTKQSSGSGMVTGLIVAVILGALLIFLPDLLRGLRQAATIETPPD